MKTNVQSLKDLYVKLGGSLTDTYSDIAGGIAVSGYSVISDVIEACAKKAVPAELPSVTDADDGDVLAVTDGTWAKAELSVDTDVLVVRCNVTYNYDTNLYDVSDFTHSKAEILAANASGKAVMLHAVITGIQNHVRVYEMPLTDHDSVKVVFSTQGATSFSNELERYAAVTLYTDEYITYSEFAINPRHPIEIYYYPGTWSKNNGAIEVTTDDGCTELHTFGAGKMVVIVDKNNDRSKLILLSSALNENNSYSFCGIASYIDVTTGTATTCIKMIAENVSADAQSVVFTEANA